MFAQRGRRWLVPVTMGVLACGGDSGSEPDPDPDPKVVATLQITAPNTELVPGQGVDLTVVARDAGGATVANPQIAWSTSASTIATVSGTGRVTAQGPGDARITATSGSASASVDFTVGEGRFIGNSGGTLIALDGAVRLVVPGGAVSTGTAFTAEVAATAPNAPRLIPGTAITINPSGTVFAAPATLQIRFPEGLGADVVIPRLRLARLVGGMWVESVPLPVDMTTRMAGAEIQQAGTWAVMEQPESLRGLAQVLGFEIGSEVNAQELRTDAPFRQNLAEHFNSVTPGNPMKFGPIHPAPNTYNFTDADLVVDFATTWGMEVHGHVLLWHSQQPGWVSTLQTRTEMLAALKSHIETVVGRYKGRLKTWDVANEMIADNGTGMRQTFWTTVIGPDVVDSAFVWANRVDPEARLFLNEYGAEGPNAKSDSLFALAKRLKAAGIPIHGVGFQAHFGTNFNAPSRAQMLANFQRFADEGFQIRVTELDVRIPNGADHLAQQATIYGNTIGACLDLPLCGTLTVWGHSDRYSWIPNFAPGFGRATPFDDALQPKPAYFALRDALAGAAPRPSRY